MNTSTLEFTAHTPTRPGSLVANSGTLMLFSGFLLTLGCSTVDRDPPVPDYVEGVTVYCGNNNSPPDQNWWLHVYPCGQDCWEATQWTSGLTVCASALSVHEDFNFYEDWYCPGGTDDTDTGDGDCDPYREWETELRALCTEKCVSVGQHDEVVTASHCLDANWTGFSTGLWTPEGGGESNCATSKLAEIAADPDASNIDWNEGAGTPLYYSLSCSLTSDCYEEFDADPHEWALASLFGGEIGPILADSRQADFHSNTVSTTLEFDMNSGAGSGYDDEHSLTGHAEYSASNCGDDICPFYLATFEASNTADDWDIWLELGIVVDEPKIVSDISIEALTSTYAVWRPATGQVAFFKETLVFEVGFGVDSDCGICTGLADGTYEFAPITNPDVIYGHYDTIDNSLEFDFSFGVPGGEATLKSKFNIDGSPPRAALALDPTEECNHSNGYELSRSDVSSTDPDDDIDGHLWIVDGEPYSHGHVMAVGAHTVETLAIDSRGARSYAGPMYIDVTTGSLCL